MKVFVNIIVMVAGLVAIVFHVQLANSMMKYYPPSSRPRAFVVMRVAYVLIGILMISICSWALYRNE